MIPSSSRTNLRRSSIRSATAADPARRRGMADREARRAHAAASSVTGLADAQGARPLASDARERDPDLGPEDITTIVRVIVSPDNPNYALRLLKMAVKLYPFQPHAQIKLEPWLVQRALDRLGDRRLNATQRSSLERRGRLKRPDGRTGGKHSVGGSKRWRRHAFTIRPCRTGSGAAVCRGAPAPRRSEVRIPSAPPGSPRVLA